MYDFLNFIWGLTERLGIFCVAVNQSADLSLEQSDHAIEGQWPVSHQHRYPSAITLKSPVQRCVGPNRVRKNDLIL